MEHQPAEGTWRIHEITPDFRLYGVWDLPTPGGAGDFPKLVHLFTDGTAARTHSPITRLLFAIRWKLGALLHWDGAGAGVGGRVQSLRMRLPSDLRGAPPGPSFSALPFSPVFLLEHEAAAEMANRTVHGVLHLRWVPDGAGGYHGQMAVLVKPNGWLGRVYMAGISPFRHLLVYPSLMRGIGEGWRRTAGAEPRHGTA